MGGHGVDPRRACLSLAGSASSVTVSRGTPSARCPFSSTPSTTRPSARSATRPSARCRARGRTRRASSSRGSRLSSRRFSADHHPPNALVDRMELGAQARRYARFFLFFTGLSVSRGRRPALGRVRMSRSLDRVLPAPATLDRRTLVWRARPALRAQGPCAALHADQSGPCVSFRTAGCTRAAD
jgi:hypothetical protein